MKPQKITGKPQHWLAMTWRKQQAGFYFYEKYSILPFSKLVLKFFFLDFDFGILKE